MICSGLVGRADLNGSIGVITSYSNEQQRWIIMVDGEPKKLAMKEERLEVLAEWSWLRSSVPTDTWRRFGAVVSCDTSDDDDDSPRDPNPDEGWDDDGEVYDAYQDDDDAYYEDEGEAEAVCYGGAIIEDLD